MHFGCRLRHRPQRVPGELAAAVHIARARRQRRPIVVEHDGAGPPLLRTTSKIRAQRRFESLDHRSSDRRPCRSEQVSATEPAGCVAVPWPTDTLRAGDHMADEFTERHRRHRLRCTVDCVGVGRLDHLEPAEIRAATGFQRLQERHTHRRRQHLLDQIGHHRHFSIFAPPARQAVPVHERQHQRLPASHRSHHQRRPGAAAACADSLAPIAPGRRYRR